MGSAPATRQSRIISWVLRIALFAAMLFMGAIPKLVGQDISVAVFEQLGQPWARIPVGLMELAGALLIIVPRTAFLGGGLIAATMVGAVGSHVVGPLGMAPELPNPDGVLEPMGAMVYLAIAFLVMASTVAFLHRPVAAGQAASAETT